MEENLKQLLLIDLCARLPYGVKFEFTSGNVRIAKGIDLGVTDEGEWEYFVTSKGTSAVEITEIKPYLRPMSSMTEKEKEHIKNRWCYNDWDIDGPSSLWREKIDVEDAEGIIDYFNAHYLDYRGLIPMGLALEAPEGMYD